MLASNCFCLLIVESSGVGLDLEWKVSFGNGYCVNLMIVLLPSKYFVGCIGKESSWILMRSYVVDFIESVFLLFVLASDPIACEIVYIGLFS